MMLIPLVCILTTLWETIDGNIIPCVCNYHVQRSVYGTQSSAVFPVAFLYENDCLPIVENITLGDNWTAVIYSDTVAYISMDSLVKEQLCNGTKPYIQATTFPDTTFKTTEQNALSTRQKGTALPSTTKQTTTSQKSTQNNTTTRNIDYCLHSFTKNDTKAIGYYRGYCYELTATKKSWNIAKKYCNEHGGHLATVTILEQRYLNEFIFDHLPYSTHSAVWIGLNDIQHEGLFIWTNGATLTYTNWVSDHGDNDRDPRYEDCVVMMADTGEWDTQPCAVYPTYPYNRVTHSVLCQYTTTVQFPTLESQTSQRTANKYTTIPSTTRTSTTIRPTTKQQRVTPMPTTSGKIMHCPESFNVHDIRAVGKLGGYCYELMITEKTRSDANKNCTENGGYLVAIYSIKEQTYIHQFINTHLPRSVHYIWIGLNDIHFEGRFVWTNDVSPVFTYWNACHNCDPALNRYEDCVVMKADTGKWYAQTCAEKDVWNNPRTHAFICQYNNIGVGSNLFVG